MKDAFKIVIAGAGVTGLTAAARLSGSAPAGSVSITVIDAAAPPVYDDDGDVALRVSAIAHGSTELLRELGAWPVVEQARACPYDHMRVWDEADDALGQASLRFDADEFAVPHLGFIVENVLLQHALLESLRDGDVDVRFDAPLTSIETNERAWRVILGDELSLDADLIIAADGGGSAVRRSLGMEVTRQTYEQTAFVTHLEPERAHGNTARQRFLREGPIGMLPLSDGRISVVWSTTPEKAKAATDAGDKALGATLTAVSDSVLGKLVVAGPRGRFPLAAQHAKDYVRQGVALIGDAAHTLHPLAGQGANLGLQDADVIADVIVTAIEAGENPADRPVLRRYERARKGANATMMHFMTGLNRLFASDSQLLGEIRRAGMQLFNRAGPVRQHVVSVALGASRR